MTNVDDLIKLDMLNTIPWEDVDPILSTTPFYKLDGGFNTRDLSDGTHTNLKQGYAYRSGSLENLTPQGQDELVKLGVTTIFDLRSIAEFSSFPSPNIEGIDRIPATINNSWDVQAAEAGTLNLGLMYIYMLSASKPGFRAIFTHILNYPEKPFLFHCAAGKDRTGVTAAIILALAGLPKDYITREYALTRIGVEPVRDLLTMKLTGGKSTDIRTLPPIMQELGNARYISNQ